MFDWVEKALNMVNTGIIIIDSEQNIVFWNDEIYRLCQISKQEALARRLSEVCPKFDEAKYQNIFVNVFDNGQSRFCSSVLHKAFVFPKQHSNFDAIRQNMKVEPIVFDNRVDYVLIQIMDITDQVVNENNLKEVINELKLGYEKAKESEKASKELAKYDHLTGLYNRSYFEKKLNKIIAETTVNNGKLAFMFMDLDGFKQVNDKHGHLVGDILLQQVAGRLLINTRKTDIVARMGGDEFIIIQNNLVDMQDAETFAEKLVNALKKPYHIDNKRISTSTSVGISIFPDMSDDIERLIKYADTAMYTVKESGKNNFGFYDKKSNIKKDRKKIILD